MADLPGNTSTTTKLPFGVRGIRGVWEFDRDQDWYRVQLQAGKSYSFLSINNLDEFSSTNFARLRLHDSSGKILAQDTGVLATAVYYTAQRSGTHYVDTWLVEGPRPLPAGYRLFGSPDCRGDYLTTCRLALGKEVTASLMGANEADWWSVELRAGRAYTVTLEAPSLIELSVRVINRNGKVIAEQREDFDVTLKNVVVQRTGRFFIEIQSTNQDSLDQGGLYTLLAG